MDFSAAASVGGAQIARPNRTDAAGEVHVFVCVLNQHLKRSSIVCGALGSCVY